MDFAKPTQAAQRNLQFLAEDIAITAKLAAGKQIVPYIGLTGYHNLGDDVLYLAHQRLFPDVTLVPYRKESVAIEKFARAIHRPFCNYAMLGGGTLINDGDVWLGKAQRLLDQGARMFCIGTGAESSAFYGADDATNTLLKRWGSVLEQFEFVGVRGPQSKAILERAGIKNVTVTGDTALALTEETMPARSSTGVVGITYGDVKGNPMWGDPAQYRQELIKVIRTLISSGQKVVLLPIWDIDIPSNQSLLDEIDSPDCTMQLAFHSYDAFSAALRRCDIFIGQKLHSTIIALMNRVPSIMVEYRPKCRDFMASVGLEDYIVKTSELRCEEFMKLYERLQKNQKSVVSDAESRILAYKHGQFDRAKKLNELFDSTKD